MGRTRKKTQTRTSKPVSIASLSKPHSNNRRKAACVSAATKQTTPAAVPIRSDASSRLKVYRMSGDFPGFNDWCCDAVDHENQLLYIYGGCPPDDSDGNPTNNLYCCDLRTMRWTNHSDSLTCLPRPGDPFGGRLESKSLPRLHHAACVLMVLNGRRFLLLFGGRIGSALTSDLIAIRLDDLTWWTVPVEGGSVVPRMAASVAVVGTCLYIFGGLKKGAGRPYDEIRTFSIAEYVVAEQKWMWIKCDTPYPEHVPELGFLASVAVVYEGKKILLTAGRKDDDEPMNLSCDACVLFHTTHHTFQAQSGTVGGFPQSVGWYCLQPFAYSVLPASQAPERIGSRIRRPTEKVASGSSSSMNSIKAAQSTLSANTSALICAWIPHTDDYLVPELWHYLLPPEEECRCLNWKDRFWNANIDLRLFVVVGTRCFLLGQDGPDDSANAVWNICVEVSL